VRAEELKQSDQLFIAIGIEEQDVEPNITRLQLGDDPEYKGILDEWSVKSQNFLQAKARESLKGHAQADATRARQRVEL